MQPVVHDLRACRRTLKVSQARFARRLGVSTETYRVWESGRRRVPAGMIAKARALVPTALHEDLLSLPELAQRLGIHPRTLRKAAHDGRLRVTYDTRTLFGKLIARATLAAGNTFKETYYRQTTSWNRPPIPRPFPDVPPDYEARVRALRQRLGLTQTQLAVVIGAASKAVVYQWESRKRVPSPLFWRKIEELRHQS